MENERQFSSSWQNGLVAHVGKALRQVRGARSAKWLSDRTEELGMKISPTIIAKLDSGHRGSVLSLSEVLILCAALDTSLIALLEGAETLPGRRESRTEIAGRLVGSFPPASCTCGAPAATEHYVACPVYEPPLTTEELRKLRTMLSTEVLS